MDELIDKPPWKSIIFFKPKHLVLKKYEYKEFEDNIPDYLVKKKEEINEYEEQHKWELAKKLANPYEMVYTQEEKFPHSNISLLKPLSRSYFKMIEILEASEFIETVPKEWNHIRSAHIAEGPGGFIQATIDYVQKYKKEVKKMYAMTLKSDKHYIPGWKKANTFLKKHEHILNISYGKDGTGDIYNVENQNYFIKSINKKVHLFTADGGFDFSVNYTYQEKQIFDLVISSFLIGLQCLTINGFMVIKLFDTYSPSTKALINLVGSAFKDYSIYKPATSRPCNSERYFIGRNYLGLNTSIIDILHTFHIKVKFDLYPYTTLDSDELGFINSISDEYEKSQIDCIDQAKEFALNTHLYENVYEKHYQASLNFCSTFKIPIKTKNIQKLTWDFENHH